MPNIPYIVWGTVSDIDSNLLNTISVVANNTTTSVFPTGKTNSLGRYAIDLANGGYSSGDSITVSALVNDGDDIFA